MMNKNRQIAFTRTRAPNRNPANPFMPAWSVALLLTLSALNSASAIADTEISQNTHSLDETIAEGYVESDEKLSADTEWYRSVQGFQLRRHESHDPDIVITRVGMQLLGDRDHDGYFGGFSVSFDVDVDYGEIDVYANIYLQPSLYQLNHLHTTHTFTVFGDLSSDEYRVEVGLLDNYPANHYDIQIDIHDAYTDRVLDSVSAHGFSNLRNLPLESEHRHVKQNDDVLIVEYAGHLGPLLLLLLGGIGMTRYAPRRR